MTKYTFVDVIACNMCCANQSQFRTLGMRINKSQGHDPRRTTGVAISVVKCGQCGLIFPNPMPIPESILDHYSMPAEDYWKDNRADPVAIPASVERLKRLKGMLAGNTKKKALEVGVGSGAQVLAMEMAGFEAHGFEPIAQFLDVAKKVTGLPEGRLRLAGIDDADYPSESFDFISFSAVLEHLYDPGGSISKVIDWLKPSGLIYAEIPSTKHLIARIVNGLMRIRGTSLVTHTSPMHNPFHLYEFDEASFRAHGNRFGYELADVEYEVCSIRHVPRVVHGPLRFVMNRTKTGMQMHVALRKN